MLGRLMSWLVLIPVLPYALFLTLQQIYLGAYPAGVIPFGGLSLSQKLLNHLYLFFQYGF